LKNKIVIIPSFQMCNTNPTIFMHFWAICCRCSYFGWLLFSIVFINEHHPTW